jgi:glycosyltransferase involved in cell wall biosynthesis
MVCHSSRGPATIILDEIAGMLIASRRPEALADAITGLPDKPERRGAIGTAGRASALARFDQRHHVAAVTCARR